MLSYDWGPRHPLRPVRLKRTMDLLRALGAVGDVEPPECTDSEVLRVHSREYVEAVKSLSARRDRSAEARFGFGSGDCPAFDGMHDAAMTYVSGSVAAALAVRDGASRAFNLSGGLHHAQRSRASGFCIYNDPAIACAILRERFDRVAYVDIDLHAGDGVQALFAHDPTVLTISIHQDPSTLYPGTGFAEEGLEAVAVMNIPVAPGTTGDVWLDAFRRCALPALEAFEPGAVVLQMGTDAHDLDPLGHLSVSVQHWRAAAVAVSETGLPIVALGGGGYEMSTVPRMWVSASMALGGLSLPDALPADLVQGWGPTVIDDPEEMVITGRGKEFAKEIVQFNRERILPRLAAL